MTAVFDIKERKLFVDDILENALMQPPKEGIKCWRSSPDEKSTKPVWDFEIKTSENTYAKNIHLLDTQRS